MRSPNERHIDAALSNISVAYRNALTAYVAMIILPIISVGKRSDKYFVFDKGNMSRSDSRRKDKTKANRVSYELSEDSYYCENYALYDIVSDEDRENSDFGQPEADSTEFLTDKILLDYEYLVASHLTDTSNMTQNTTLSGTAQFNDYTNSDPKTVIQTGKSAIFTATGKKANTMVVPYEVALTLANHPHVQDVLKYTDDKILTRSGLPPVLWGLNVLEAGASENTAKKGQTDSLSALWGKNIIIASQTSRINGLKRLKLKL